MVPDKPVFKTVLRAIKLWAKRNGLYSNVLGYLGKKEKSKFQSCKNLVTFFFFSFSSAGGFSWSILVAKICLLGHPSPATELLRQFFQVYNKWQWSDQAVMLQDYEEVRQVEIFRPIISRLARACKVLSFIRRGEVGN